MDEIRELVGRRDAPTGSTVPIKLEDLAAVLDSIRGRGDRAGYLAVALVGLYGLRPAELATLEVRDGCLYVGEVKRTRHGTQKTPRLALPLDLPGREGEGAQVLDTFASDVIRLPAAIRNAPTYKRAGAAFARLLGKDPTWRSLGLRPYALRHGYAWRGVKAYSRALSVHDLAALMGHTPRVHLQHYGCWTSEEDLMEACHGLL